MNTELSVELSFFNLNLKLPAVKTDQAVRQNFRTIRHWMRSQTKDNLREFQYAQSRALRLIGVKHRHEIPQHAEDEQLRTAACERSNAMLARNYGIDPALIASSLARYAERSNSIVTGINNSMPPDMAGRFEMVNEVQIAEDPFDLLAIIYSERYAPRAHQQAFRKLQHMEAARLIEENPRLQEMRNKFRLFTAFMNGVVWMQDRRIGDFHDVYLLSEHNTDDKFSCTSVKILEISPEDAETFRQQLPLNYKLTLASRRRFQIQEGPEKGKVIDVYVTNRLKDTEDQMVKIERKGNNHSPETSIKDALGYRFVTNTKKELESLIKHLQYCADFIGSDTKIHDIMDSLDGDSFNGTNAGSSTELQMLKFLVRIDNVELEMQGLDSISYVNQLYKEGVSHEEYQVRRLFESGWMERNFPYQLYEYDPVILMQRMITKIRQDIQGIPNCITAEITESAVTPQKFDPPITTGKLLTTINAAISLAARTRKKGSDLISSLRSH